MTYDVKLTVAAKPEVIVHWKRNIEAKTPEGAVYIADRLWRAEWKEALPRTEKRVYVFRPGEDNPILELAFQWAKDDLPIEPQ